MTIGDIIIRVREAVDDTVLAVHRVGEASLGRMAVDGCRELRRICPSSCYYRLALDAVPLPDITDDMTDAAIDATVLRLDSRWLAPIFHYVCARVFALDSGDNNNRVAAADHMNQFNAACGVK